MRHIEKNAHMWFIFNKLMNFFCVVNTTVIEYKDAAGSRIWVCEW